MDSVRYDDAAGLWAVRAGGPLAVTARYVITATGALSAASRPLFEGAGGLRRRAVRDRELAARAGAARGQAGGSDRYRLVRRSGLPELARQALSVTVLQRTAQYVTPARQERLDPDMVALWKANYQEIRRRTKITPGGIPIPSPLRTAQELSAAEQSAVARRRGAAAASGSWTGCSATRSQPGGQRDHRRVRPDEDRADRPRSGRGDKLKPRTHAWGTKRVPVGSDYYETYNRPNVSLVDLRADPIERITQAGSGLAPASTSST